MGVSYYSCAACSRGYDEENEEKRFPDRIDQDKPITCVICRKEEANDNILLHALLKHFKLTREQALEIWQKEPEEDNGE